MARFWTDAIGIRVCAGVMLCVALVPLAGVLSDILAVRMVGTTCALAVWLLILGTVVAVGSVSQPACGTALVCLLAYSNAEYRLAQQVIARRAMEG